VSLAGILEAGRRDFLDAVRESDGSRATAGWSVLECIEHVILVEQRYFSWMEAGSAGAPPRDSDRELRLFAIARSRLEPREAPDALRPHGCFSSCGEAVAEFEAVRNRTIRFVEERGDALYAIGATHPYFGELNGAELVQLIDGHTRRHADQIREIGESR
jgi:hypothetical protein